MARSKKAPAHDPLDALPAASAPDPAPIVAATIVFKLRPLALQVGWVWAVAGLFFLLYLLIALAFPRPVQVCVDELGHRPATTFLLGLVTKLVVPLVILILAITGVGVLVVPFILIAVFLGAAVGKVALLQWLGLRVGRQFGVPALQAPLVALIVGAVILTLLYLVWVIGLLAFALFSIWGLGVAVSATFAGVRREMPEKQITIQPPSQPPVMPMVPAAPFSAAPADAPGVATPQQPAVPRIPPVVPPTLPEAWSYPKAGFWERTGDGLRDGRRRVGALAVRDQRGRRARRVRRVPARARSRHLRAHRDRRRLRGTRPRRKARQGRSRRRARPRPRRATGLPVHQGVDRQTPGLRRPRGLTAAARPPTRLHTLWPTSHPAGGVRSGGWVEVTVGVSPASPNPCTPASHPAYAVSSWSSASAALPGNGQVSYAATEPPK